MSFTNEFPVKAVRKRHRCDMCGQHIEIGEPAIRWAGMTDSGFAHAMFHPDCREAEVGFNHEYGVNAHEWYSLAHDRDGDDNVWLLAEFPAVAARLGVEGLL